MSGSRTVFVDTAAWVALTDTRDRCHKPAQRFFAETTAAGARLLTTDYVLDATYTLLRRRRNGLPMARALRELVHDSDLIDMLGIDRNLRESAWELFTGYDDKMLSFTDCTSFAVMREHGVSRVFTFDGDFHKVGFVAVPEM